MVLLGKTEREPEWLTGPMPLFIITLEALVASQLNVAIPAGTMTPGLTLIWATGKGPEGAGVVTVVVDDALLTVTVADLVTDPEALTAVNVYVVVTAGVTVLVPAADIEPIPWSTIKAVALDTLQLSSDELPSDMVVGLAVKEFTVGTPPNGRLTHDASKSGIANISAKSK